MIRRPIAIFLVCFLSTAPLYAADNDLSSLLKTLGAADGTSAKDRAAAKAASQLQSIPSSQLTSVLAGFEGATRRGRNWLRALAADVCDNGPFPKQELLNFFDDRSGDKDARYVAYQLLVGKSSELKPRLLQNAETDPSLPVRYLKIESLLDQAAKTKESDASKAKSMLQTVVANGRSPKQLEKATKMLGDMGVKVDLAKALAMMTDWWLIGPFDNTDSKQFDTAYTPEQRYLETGSPIAYGRNRTPQPEKAKDNKMVQWQAIGSDDKLGMVDLNQPLDKAKDAAAYVYTRFKVVGSLPNQSAQVRLGCITANKVWLNGQLITSNEVYHSGTRIDQYVAPCELATGENTLLIKVMQNAQTESWAQDYQFQFRLTRPDGSPIRTKTTL